MTMRRFSFKTLTTFFSATLLVLFGFSVAHAQEDTAAALATTVRLLGQPVDEKTNTVEVKLEVNMVGSENALGFSFIFYAPHLDYTGFQNLDSRLAVYVNPNVSGILGYACALPPGQAFAPGKQTLAVFKFRLKKAGPTPLRFWDKPVIREVVDKETNVLPSIFVDGLVYVNAPVAGYFDVSPDYGDAGDPVYVFLGDLQYMDSAIIEAVNGANTWTVGKVTPDEGIKRFEFTPPPKYTRFNVYSVKFGVRSTEPISTVGVYRAP